MTITYVIPNARTVDQLNEPTLDGQPDENKSDNCVVASLSEGLNILTGKTFDGDELKDAVYGQGYTGGTAARSFVDYCAQQGVRLTPFNGSQQELVATIHGEIHQNHPVILTMPSNWNTPPADPLHPGASHVGLAVGDGPGEIRVMNPWHGFMQDASDAWWQARLCYGQVWVMEATGDFVVIGLSDTSGYFTEPTPGVWQCKNGQKIQGAILNYYRNNEGFRLFGLPKTDELVPDDKYVGRVQIFERGAIAFDPARHWDHVVTEPDPQCYAAHIDSGYVASQLGEGLGSIKAALDAAYVTLLTDAQGIVSTVDSLKKLVP